jgi:hypothetical protein
VTLNRNPAAAVLAATAAAVVVASAAWAYASFGFWEGGPIMLSVGSVAALSAGAVYAARRRLRMALMVALFVGVGYVVLLLAITNARWEG